MNARVYANTTALSLTADLDGAEFVPPIVTEGQDIYLRFRPSREIEGVSVSDDREIRGVSLRLGRAGASPEQGTYKLSIKLGSTTVESEAIAYNASASEVASAINEAIESDLSSLRPCTVTEHLDGMRIVFADNSATPEIWCSDNELWPISFVEVDAIEFDAGWAYMLDLRQAPVAEASGGLPVLARAPWVEQRQVGGNEDGIVLNEIQMLWLPGDFAGGSFQLTRGKRSRPIPAPPTMEQLRLALEDVADVGGSFVLTQVVGGVLIEFQGSMAGDTHPLIGVEVFDAPPQEYLVRMSTRTAGVREIMRAANAQGRIELPMLLEFEIEDPETEDLWERKIIRTRITLERAISDGSRSVSMDLRWDQPIGRRSYERTSMDAVLVGSRARAFVIGDGDAESFLLPHNLGANALTVTANATTNLLTAAEHGYQDYDPVVLATSGTLPAPLSAGTVYFVRDAETDTFRLAAAPAGPAIDLTDAGSGTHTVRLKDGTLDAVSVDVWDAGTGERLPQSDYVATVVSEDAVEVSGFPTTPTSGQYRAIVTAVGRPATYQRHLHEIDETPEAKTRIEALEARVTALENGSYGGEAPASSRVSGRIERPLPRVWRIPRARVLPQDPGTLLDWNPFAQGDGEVGVAMRDIRLLPAVHVAFENVEPLPTNLPAPSAAYRGRVFRTVSERTDFPGGVLPAGGYAACDGRDWYQVSRESEAETTWYPTVFGGELFRFSVSPDELALRSRLELAFGFEVALHDPNRRPEERRTRARMSLLIERGVRSADATPATTGSNVDRHFTEPVVLLRHDFDVTQVPAGKRFSLTVARDGNDVLTAMAGKFFQAPVSVDPPASADFVLRARLARFDVENLPEDGRGVLAIRGLDVGMDGMPESGLGRYVIF